MKKISLFILLCSSLLINAQSPVAKNGALSVKGNQILNSKNEVVSFAGNSFFWSNTGWEGAVFYNKHAVKWLKDDWKATIVRCAMAADPKIEGGYLDDPKGNEKRVDRVVKAAIKYGLYVIIDWHSHHAEDNEAEAIAFFQKMAKKYGQHPNIIYEIYNEPLKISWNDVVKPYSERVIAAIRKIDKNNLIIVGTTTWSQDVDVASKNPILGFSNIAYTLHFYAGTHKEGLRKKAQVALDNGIALMVTEWGTVNADGDGGANAESVAEWMAFMKKNNLSHCNWAVDDKKEGASIVHPGANPKGGWSDDNLTESGKLTKSYIVDWDK